MSVHEIAGEVIPTDEELELYPGLMNLRLRRDGAAVVGLFITEATKQPVITIADRKTGSPRRFPVEENVANSAYEQPLAHLDKEGRELLEKLLTGRKVA